MSSKAAANATREPKSGRATKNNHKKSANEKKKAIPIDNDDTKDKTRKQGGGDDDDDGEQDSSAETNATGDDTNADSKSNGHVVKPSDNGSAIAPPGGDTSAKLEAMGKEREALRTEVEQLRKQLESIQETHNTEVSQLKSDLEESNTAKETAEEQYQTLLERVEKIKETLSDRLRRDKAELEEAKERIEELETQNEQLQNSATTSGEDSDKLKQELQDANRELSTLRSRSNLSTQNWSKEKEELTRTVQHLKEEMETTANAMGEWEVIAMEERSVKESLSEKVADLEDQINTLRQNYEGATAERDSQSTLIDNLQNALREIQEARKKELRDMVETTEEQLQAQKKLVQEAESRATEAQESKASMSKELERTAPFEKEVKEKNLLIGKLRHEAIVLNDHLTKALRYLKKTKPEDNVDRHVITNHLLHFLTLDRSDAKRFQVLQVMAGYLNWTDEQREQAGLARPGGSSNSLRLPSSPFRRTPSSPSLKGDVFAEPTHKDKESLAELWAGFLERSAQEGKADDSSTTGSRKASVSSAATGSTAATEKPATEPTTEKPTSGSEV